jgi:hypothetical protein
MLAMPSQGAQRMPPKIQSTTPEFVERHPLVRRRGGLFRDGGKFLAAGPHVQVRYRVEKFGLDAHDYSRRAESVG